MANKILIKMIKPWGRRAIGDVVEFDESKGRRRIADGTGVLFKGKPLETASMKRAAEAGEKKRLKEKADAEQARIKAESREKAKAEAESKTKTEAEEKANAEAEEKAKAEAKTESKKKNKK